MLSVEASLCTLYTSGPILLSQKHQIASFVCPPVLFSFSFLTQMRGHIIADFRPCTCVASGVASEE